MREQERKNNKGKEQRKVEGKSVEKRTERQRKSITFKRKEEKRQGSVDVRKEKKGMEE